MSERDRQPDPRRDRRGDRASNEVILFMKGTPEQPACGFSARTVAALQALGAPFAAVDILPDPRIRQELSAISNWPTIPQLFVDGELVGGCDIVTEMYETGELAEALGVEASRAGPSPRTAAPRPRAAGHREPARPRPARRDGRARVRWRHGRRHRARTSRCAGTARAWRSSTRRCLPGARGVARRSSGAADTAAGDPPPGRPRRAADRHRRRLRAGDGGRAAARPRHARGRLGAAARRRARPRSTCAYAVDRVRAAALAAGPATMAGGRARGGRAHPRRGGRGVGARIAAHGADAAGRRAARSLTHCNTGALAAGGRGHGARRDPRAARARRASTSSPARRARCCRARG